MQGKDEGWTVGFGWEGRDGWDPAWVNATLGFLVIVTSSLCFDADVEGVTARERAREERWYAHQSGFSASRSRQRDGELAGDESTIL